MFKKIKNNLTTNHRLNKIIIPSDELKFEFSRSSGAGGQNVNKLNTKAIIRWNFVKSGRLNSWQKELIKQKLKNRLNEDGDLMVYSQKTRLQKQNKNNAIKKINEFVNLALAVQRYRIPTKTTRTAKEKRLKQKKIKSRIKVLRKGMEL